MAQKASSQEIRCLGFAGSCRHQQTLQASLLGLSQEEDQSRALSVLGGTALLCPLSGLHTGAVITEEKVVLFSL